MAAFNDIRLNPLSLQVCRKELVIRSPGRGRILERVPLPGHPVAPLIKWAGGKQWLARAALSLAPPGWNRTYFEPFLGAGAMFFALKPTGAVLGDTNAELVATYQTVRRSPNKITRLLKSYPYNERFYYRIRERKPRTSSTRAARFLYLNRACWNGLYRVNHSGSFNTPFGRYTNPGICDEAKIVTAAKALRKAVLQCGDFSVTLSRARKGDFAYIDPPFAARWSSSHFAKYNAQLFSWADQVRLAQLALGLARKGVHILVSNANQKSVVRMYAGFRYYRCTRRSLIAGKSDSRRVVHEALLSNYPIAGLETTVIPWQKQQSNKSIQQ